MIGFGKAWNREEQFDDILLDPNRESRIEDRLLIAKLVWVSEERAQPENEEIEKR